MNDAALVHHTGIDLRPDHSRVIASFFLPGVEDVGPGHSRAAPVIQRILDLSEAEVETAYADVEQRFIGRHPDLRAMFDEHARMVMTRIDPDMHLSGARHMLLGACFTHESTIEGAALCNPSAVLHPVQSGDDTAFEAEVVALSQRGEPVEHADGQGGHFLHRRRGSSRIA